MVHQIALPVGWKMLVFVYVPLSYFVVRGFLFETYRVAAWLLKLMGVDG